MMRPPLPALLIVAPLLAACSSDDDQLLQGYVEGIYVNIAAETGGRLIERPVRAGQRVSPGDLLFSLDDADQLEAVAAAEARLAQARAELANLKTGKREEEVAVIAADLARERTAFNHAEDDYRRKLQLRQSGFAAQSILDDARTRRDTAEASAEAIERQLLVARLPARPEQVEAAERNVAAFVATLSRARIRLDRRTMVSPVAALVEDTLFEVGELVGSGRTVVSLLPDDNRMIRFFVPQAELAGTGPGQTVGVGCDGCAEGMTAIIEFVATEAEFTPPIIFSQDTREKLVFLVEARPTDGALKLKVGQPVDVTIMSE